MERQESLSVIRVSSVSDPVPPLLCVVVDE